MNKIKVVIAEDNDYYRKGLKTILLETEGIEFCGDAKDGITLLRLLSRTKADVVLMDIQMPKMGGVEATKIIKEKYPQINVIAFTMYNSAYLIADMLDAGAKAYIDKNTRIEHLLEAIKTVYEGFYYHCPSTTMHVSRIVASSKSKFGNENVVFNEEEIKIIKLICEELGSKQIAMMLGLSVSSVEKYRKRIQVKMGVINVAGLVVYALKNKLYVATAGKL